jgi:hypothetical protein
VATAESQPVVGDAADPHPPSDPHPAPRVHTGELISFVCAVALVPIMFGLDWYGVVGLPRHGGRSGLTTAEDAWRELTVLRWLMLVTVVAAVAAVVLHATQRSHGAKTDTSIMVTTLGTVTALLVGYRVLFDLPNSNSVVDVKIGAYLGLIAAVGIAIGGWESVREVRERRGTGIHHRARVKTPIESRPDAP